MEKARTIIREVLARAKRPAMLWSGGKDSQLLLTLIREIQDVPLLWFRSDKTPQQTEFAKRMIRDLDLQVFSYAPAEVYFLPNGNDVTLIHGYSFGRHRFPALTDIEESERCSLKLDSMRTPHMSHVWDVIFTGLKDSDRHPVLGMDFLPDDGYWLGDAQIFSPLRHMTDSEVWGVIDVLGVPVDTQRYSGDTARDDGIAKLCTRCFNSQESEVFCPEEQKMIPVFQWDRAASLSGFRQFYGLETVNA